MVRVARTLRRLAVMHNTGVCKIKTREGFHPHGILPWLGAGEVRFFFLRVPPPVHHSRREKDEQMEIVEESHGQQA